MEGSTEQNTHSLKSMARSLTRVAYAAITWCVDGWMDTVGRDE
jgi:hypothetical protein